MIIISDIVTAAAYIRVSTDDQVELSPDSQIKVVKEYAQKNGYIISSEHIYRDDGISGRRADKRPEFNRMIATAKQKPSPFHAVLLWKFSRFARNQEESIFYKSMLRKNGVEVISVSEPVIEGPFGTLIERIIEWSDEYYSIRLSGEVKRGMKEKVSRGEAVSVPSFGYDIVDKNYIINPEKAAIVKKIYNDYLSGIPSIQIARNLNMLGIKTNRGNIWENRTVDYILQNPVYVGKIRWNPERRTRRNYDDKDILIVDGHHEAIIDAGVFEKVKAIYAENRKKHLAYTHSTVQSEYMLHGLIKCSSCGGSLCLNAAGNSLQCVKYTHGKCNTSHAIVLHKINDIVISSIEKAFRTKTFNVNVRNTSRAEILIDYDVLIEKEHSKLERVKNAYAEGVYTIDELRGYKQAIEDQITHLHNEKNKHNREIDIVSAKNKLVDENIDLIKKLRNKAVSEEEKHEILSGFIDKIVFDRATSSIEIFFYV